MPWLLKGWAVLILPRLAYFSLWYSGQPFGEPLFLSNYILDDLFSSTLNLVPPPPSPPLVMAILSPPSPPLHPDLRRSKGPIPLSQPWLLSSLLIDQKTNWGQGHKDSQLSFIVWTWRFHIKSVDQDSLELTEITETCLCLPCSGI